MKTIPLFLIMIASGLIIEGNSFAQKSVSGTSIKEPGSSKLLCDWITIHMKTIRSVQLFDHHHRQSAYTGIALYESVVNGADGYKSLAGQLDEYDPPDAVAENKEICWQASANAALATMFRFFYPQNPANKPRFDSLENAWIQQLRADGFSEASISAGSDYGTVVAEAVLAWCKGDRADMISEPYSMPTGMGVWEPTPPKYVPPATPYMGNMRTLVKGSIDNTIPPAPADFSVDKESPFYRMVEEVYNISSNLDSVQRATALFWDDFPDGKSLTSGGHWACILKNVMEENRLSLIEGALAYAEMFIATNDAAIGCFKAKYTYNMIRPVTFIHKFMNHPDWNPLINTPSHPEYPAAHAVVSMAAATMLTRIFGDTLSFTDNAYEYRGYKARRFKNFVEAGQQAGLSRYYGGIHYLPSIEAGYAQGKKIADNVFAKLVTRE